MKETKIHKVLKRIVALPTIPHDENYDIKHRATEILKQWTSHLDEIAKTEKRDAASAGEEKKGSGSDVEKDKSPPLAKENVVSGDAMEGVEKTKTGVEEKEALKVETAKSVETADMESMVVEEKPEEKKKEHVVAVEEDFVMVDAGGRVDDLSQEKAAQKVKAEEPPKPQEKKDEGEGSSAKAVDGAGKAEPFVVSGSVVPLD